MKGLTSFPNWFETKFAVAHPELATDFNIEPTTFDGQDMVEITSFNPAFGVDTLEAMFEASRLETSKKIKRDESMT
jgi:hypothetical protein